MTARNRAESTELSRFPPSRVEFCLVDSPRAGRVFEWAIAQFIVRDDPWHHIDQLCICALTSAHAFAAATCCARTCASSHRSINILTQLQRTVKRLKTICTINLLRPWYWHKALKLLSADPLNLQGNSQLCSQANYKTKTVWRLCSFWLWGTSHACSRLTHTHTLLCSCSCFHSTAAVLHIRKYQGENQNNHSTTGSSSSQPSPASRYSRYLSANKILITSLKETQV